MEIFAFVECKNREKDARHLRGRYFRIHIPGSNLPEIENGQPLLSKEVLPLRIVCPQCGHWYAYSGEEIQSGRARTSSQTEEPDADYFAVGIECGTEGCGVLTTYYVTASHGANPKKIAFGAIPEPTCKEGHVLDQSTARVHVKMA